MKKVLCVLLAIAMLVMCSCTGGGQTSKGGSETKTKATESGMPIVKDKVDISVAQCIRDVDELDYNTMDFYVDYDNRNTRDIGIS